MKHNGFSVRCNNCLWHGHDEWLIVCHDAADGEISKACPNCRTDSYLMDTETAANDLSEIAA